MSNVYILGSGFSASCGLPTLINLFPELLKFNRYGEENVNNILYALNWLYPHFNQKRQDNAYPPFEEFLSLLFVSEDFGGKSFDEGYWEQHYISCLRLLTDCIAKKASQTTAEGKDKSIKLFMDILCKGDTIITFNWDTLVERYLTKENIGISLKERINNGIGLLKLHGSLSWQRLPEDTKPKYPEYFLTLGEEDNLICRKDHAYINLWDSLNDSPYIVTPIWSKTPLKTNYLKDIWYEAFNALVDATTIVIIGYSLPQEDLHARALIRNGILLNQFKTEKNIFLIDPNPDIAGRYYTTITSKVSYFQRYFTGDECEDIFS